MPKSPNPQSVTVQMKHIPEDLRDQLAASGNRAGLLTDMLKELSQTRASVPPLSTIAKAHALKLDLKGAERALKTQTSHVNELQKRLDRAEEELNDKQRHLEMKTRLSKVQKKEARKALNHAISLVNYLGRVEPQ